MAQTTKSRVEQAVGRAHHAIYLAFQEASCLRTDDVADDLWQVLRALEAMQVALLR